MKDEVSLVRKLLTVSGLAELQSDDRFSRRSGKEIDPLRAGLHLRVN